MTDKEIIVKYLSLYELLSFEFISEEIVIEKYRLLAKKYHPDTCEEKYKNGKMFIELQKGKEFLIKNLESVNLFLKKGLYFDDSQNDKKEYFNVDSYREDSINLFKDYVNSISQNYSKANYGKIKKIQLNFENSVGKQRTIHGIENCTNIYFNQIDEINTKRRTSKNIFIVVGYVFLYAIIIVPCLIFRIKPPKLKE